VQEKIDSLIIEGVDPEAVKPVSAAHRNASITDLFR
jgi:hypothetical protein